MGELIYYKEANAFVVDLIEHNEALKKEIKKLRAENNRLKKRSQYFRNVFIANTARPLFLAGKCKDRDDFINTYMDEICKVYRRSPPRHWEKD